MRQLQLAATLLCELPQPPVWELLAPKGCCRRIPATFFNVGFPPPRAGESLPAVPARAGVLDGVKWEELVLAVASSAESTCVRGGGACLET